MSDTEQASLTRLDIVADSGNFERLLEASLEHLQSHPDSTDAHDHAAVAYIRTDQARRAKPHILHVLSHAPEEPRSHQLAASWYLTSNQGNKALHHIDEAIKQSPNEPFYHYLRAHALLTKGNPEMARAEIGKALELDPGETDYINLKVHLDSLSDDSKTGAWERIEELTDALSLDPENADLHISIGQIFLYDLEQAKLAEASFRNALSIDPKEKDAQRLLFQAIGKRSIIYRTLSLSQGGIRYLFGLGRAILAQPWRLILVAICFKAAFIFLAWLVTVTLVFYIPSKIYQWSLLSHIRPPSGPQWLQRLSNGYQRIPRPLRFLIVGTLMAGFWALLFRFFELEYALGFQLVFIFILVHLGVVTLFHFFKRGGAALARRKVQRRKKKAAQAR